VSLANFSSDLAGAGLSVRVGAGDPPVGPRGRLAEVGIQRQPGDAQVLPRRIVRVLTRRRWDRISPEGIETARVLR
jgi:hypothetical protein